MHGSYNRFMLQSVIDDHANEKRRKQKWLVSRVNPDKPGASIDVQVENTEGVDICSVCDKVFPAGTLPPATDDDNDFDLICPKCLLNYYVAHHKPDAALDGLPGTANGGELV